MIADFAFLPPEIIRGGDLSQGSLREGAPRSGGGDCGNSVLDLFTAEISTLFVHALSLSRLRDSSLPEGAYLKHRFGDRNIDLLNQHFSYKFRV